MKKAKITLLSVCASFLLVLCGIFVGRRTGNNFVSLPVNAHNASVQNEQISQTQEQIGKINLNTASVSDLTLLPGIGETIALRIISYREENGPFTQIDQLRAVSGIGDKKLDDIREYITLGG